MPTTTDSAMLDRSPAVHARIAGILFADVVGFSALSDVNVVTFFRHFWGEVGRLLEATRPPPLVRNTWGDALYLVFATIRDTGCFALELSAMTSRIRWGELGLPADLSVRVGLHAGPLFEIVDPVTGQATLSGKHATRAARVEPVTPPGMVYVTWEFAALAAVARVTEFTCEPVGRVQLAKTAGAAPLFVLRAGSAHG
jgi:class 3 adenylate cyclase